MATYTIKLVDHSSNSPDKLKGLILTTLQGLFKDVFSSSKDDATVSWGSSAKTDDLILHFVDDIANSYIAQKLPGDPIQAIDGGFTRTQGNVTGSEFYKVAHFDDGDHQVRASAMGRLAFHEGMHNKTGWSNAKLHGSDGGGGLADSPPHIPLTEKNKTILQKAFATKNAQLQ